MSNRRILVCAAVAIALVKLFSAAPARAQWSDERIFFTFSGPVELPGVGLAPGKYIFRQPDPTSTHEVIQVLNAEGNKSYGIFFTVPTVRPDPPKQPEVRFMETPAGAPQAIREYWNMGETTGHEFIYPKEQARRLAKASSKPVLTTASETTKTEQTNTADIVRLSAGGAETKVHGDGKPAAIAPSGTSQQGAPAPASIEIPRVIVILVPGRSSQQ